MSAKIFPFTGITTLPIDPDRILQANVGKFRNVLLLGYEKTGGEMIVAGSFEDWAEVILLMERAKKQMLELIPGG